ncbi:MAG: cyclodeaminase/cyclohydrolase family protein [Candidatus Adiutrix sp.]
MKLADRTLTGFSEVLASQAPAPGGGSTAALEGALGAALIHMVGALTTGKAKFAAHQPLIDQMLLTSEKIRQDFIKVIDEDTQAFNEVTAVFSLPKTTDDEKKARTCAMENALKACCHTPLIMMKLSLEALELAGLALGKTNPNAASDFGVAALSLKAAVQGAWLNILINIGGIKDAEFAENHRQQGEEILAKALPLADQIYEAVLGSL